MRLLTILLLAPFFAFSQSKGDTKITATPSDTSRLFSKLITLLYTENYIVKVEDSARGIIITEPKTIKGYMNPQVRLKLTVHPTTVDVTGEMNPGIEWTMGSAKKESVFQPIENKGMKNSINRNTWNEMDRVANIIGTVVYSK